MLNLHAYKLKAEAERIAELRKPEIAKMVERHLSIARHQMLEQLEAQAKGFEEELNTLASQLGG